MMRLSASNIAWLPEQDDYVYQKMVAYGFTGLEIAPTRIFPEDPYGHLEEAAEWARGLREKYGLFISSMQSIWYGRRENLFGSERERAVLEVYTRRAVDFAEAIGCGNLVFGCPRNRSVPGWMSREEADRVAVTFFRTLGEYARSKGTVIGLEANPLSYGTNYINRTEEALKLIRKVGSEGFKLNLDVGTMIENGEDVGELEGKVSIISHGHVSEPGLGLIRKRMLYPKLIRYLKEGGYDKYISVEMGRQDNVDLIEDIFIYMSRYFS